MSTNRFPILLASVLAGSCSGSQHVLSPNSPQADVVATLSWILFGGGTLIFVGVMALVAWAVLAPDRHRARANGLAMIVGGGIVFPVVTLAALTAYSVAVNREVVRVPDEEPLRIEVIGYMWWWEVRYPEEPDGFRLVTANEIRVPVGRPVEVTVTTADVIHSFWVPNLGGKIDLIPGKINTRVFTAREPAVMRGQCAEFCGAQHAWMAFFVVAEEPQDYEAWYERQKRPATPPATRELADGRDAFIGAGCGACHVVRGVEGAQGGSRPAPDLTHVGSRISIGAGRLENSVGALAGWIAGSQHLKPDNFMPAFDRLDGPTYRAIAAWLESLE